MRARRWVGTLALGCGLGLLGSAAEANPANKKAFAEYYGPLLVRKVDACETCHTGSAAEVPKFNVSIGKPHNAFGARLMAVTEDLKKARKKTDLTARLDAIGKEDSDGDGVSNQVELLTGHNPGLKKDLPSKAELARAPVLLAAFAKQRDVYPWEPFQSVRRPAVPKVKNAKWVRNPIDAFVAAEHEKRGLKPRPEAPREVLLRRVYLDLIGLPPTRLELQTFLADRSPDAYEKVVDRLLASPRYGERWGRHWMDVWRYSDWDGYGAEVRNSQPHIWRWRDWIVESLNQDKGYDRMVQEMLAGDELAPEDPKVLPATGFLVRNWYKFSRHETMNKLIEGTGKAFLGVTLNCARCHDHKFDPISQKEFFDFRAIFEPFDIRTDRVPGQPDVAKDGIARVYDANLQAETFFFNQGDDRKPDKNRPASPAVPAVLGGGSLPLTPVTLPLTAASPDKRDFVIREALAALAKSRDEAQSAVTAARQEMEKAEQAVATAATAEGAARVQAAREKLQLAEARSLAAEGHYLALEATVKAEQLEDAAKKGSESWNQAAQAATRVQRNEAVLEARFQLLAAEQNLPKAVAAHESAAAALKAAPADAKLQAAAKKAETDLSAARKKVDETRAALAQAEKNQQLPPSTEYTPRKIASYPATSTGRRLALARWIADAKNPLTARVAVNHIWRRHFGKAIVPSVFDFGGNGKPPTHPALLDYLATVFSGTGSANVTQGGKGAGSKGEGILLTAAASGSRGPVLTLTPTLASKASVSAPSTSNLQPSTPGMGWSMKALHRLMVTSSTYRMDSAYDPASGAKDPDNQYLWRMNSRRMEAEIVRDSLLHLSGQLDLTMGGPELDQGLGLSTKRRSLYYRHSMEKQVEFLATFDQANVNECYERDESIVPQQALALANSSLSIAQSRTLAAQLWKEQEGRPEPEALRDFLTAAFVTILGRQPTAEERITCGKFLEEQATLLTDPSRLTAVETGSVNPVPPAKDPKQRARESLVHVLLNHNEFVTVR